MNPEVAVVVSSCDKFRDLWEPFFTLFWRYWPDCPFPVYLISNSAVCSHERVSPMPVGQDRQWASNMRYVLGQMPQKYFVYLQEDYLLRKRVDTKRISELIDYMDRVGAGYLRLLPTTGPDRVLDRELGVGIIEPGAPYRVSLQAAIWRKETLEGLLIDGETAWDMEYKGSGRSDALTEPFLSVVGAASKRNGAIPVYYDQGIVKGRWTQIGLKVLEEEGLSKDPSRGDNSYWADIWRESRLHKAYRRLRNGAASVLLRLGLFHAASDGWARRSVPNKESQRKTTTGGES